MEFEAGSLGSVLERMQAKYPHVYECVCNETGRIRPHIHVFVNSELVGTSAIADMQRAIAEDDIVTIWTAVSGG
jgi:molybdopterin converting factor small subunit